MNPKKLIDRRALVLSAGAVAAGCAASALSQEEAQEETCVPAGSGATFVLVHGAWVGAWTFADLDRRLTARGHTVYRPSLSGWGERAHLAHPDINVSTSIADVRALIELEELTDIVLVGHSYGGMVITGLADAMPERISSLVYLDAFLPEDGKSIADHAGQEWRELCEGIKERGEFLLPLAVETPNGLVVLDPQPPKLTPIPVETQLEALNLTGAHVTAAKTTYVHAEGTAPYFTEAYERARENAAWTTVTVPTGHMVYEELPERTVEILEASI